MLRDVFSLSVRITRSRLIASNGFCAFNKCSLLRNVAKIHSYGYSNQSDLKVGDVSMRQLLDSHRLKTLLMKPEEKIKSFDALWSKIVSDPNPDIDLINKYLFVKTDCGLEINTEDVLNSLVKMNIMPDVRTYAAFVHDSCSRGNIEKTSVHLQAMKRANLRPDPFIFSQVLYGYTKAMCPDEVASTQDIMMRMGLWPSRIAYEGLLSAHAELGDRSGLVATLNESWEVLRTKSKTLDASVPQFPIYPTSLVQLYVKLMNAEPPGEPPCLELLTRLPDPPDRATRLRAREGVKRLLINGRLSAALELFKRIDPESADDPYLISLNRYMVAGGIPSQALSSFLELADVSGSRLNMIKRHAAGDLRRQPRRAYSLHSSLEDAVARGDVDAVFECVNREPVAVGVVYNLVVPELLRLGVDPSVVVERIESTKLRSAAAFGCVLAKLMSPERSNFKELESMSEGFIEQNLFPVHCFIHLPLSTVRKLLTNANSVPGEPSSHLVGVLDILSKALNPGQLKAVVNQLFEMSLSPFREHSSWSARQPTKEDCDTLLSVVDASIAKNIKFPANSWLFYALKNCDISQDKQDSLRLPPYENPNGKPKPTSLWRKLHDIIEAGNVEGAIELIQKFSRSEESADPATEASSAGALRFPDPVAIAYELLQSKTPTSDHSIALSPQNVERMFWAAWDGQLLSNPLRASAQIVSLYTKMSDFKGLAGFYQKAANQFGPLIDALLTHYHMEILLKDNFSENLILLQSMISNPSLSTSSFVRILCSLERIVSQHMEKLENSDVWLEGSEEYWPVQALSKRFQGNSHLQKLRAFHGAVDDLCKSNNLFAAHRLRMWAGRLGLFLFPRTNELLVLTPYLVPSQEQYNTLPRWCMSHELSQHWPVTLDSNLLATLDSLVASTSRDSTLASPVNDVSDWLIRNVSSVNKPLRSFSFNDLPVWLVVCQRLFQTGSAFTMPKTWATLVSDWLKKSSRMGTNSMLFHLNEWFTYAPTAKHQAAVLFSALANTNSQLWAENILQTNSSLLYTMASTLDPRASWFSDHLENFDGFLSKTGQKQIFDFAHALFTASGNPQKCQDLLRHAEANIGVPELAAIIVTNTNLFEPIIEHLKSDHPDQLSALFNTLFGILRHSPRRLRFAQTCYDAVREMSIDVSLLDAEKLAFLYPGSRLLNVSCPELPDPLVLLEEILPSNMKDSWLKAATSFISRQDYISLLELLQKLPDPVRKSALVLLMYTMPSSGDVSRLKKFISVLADHFDGDMLQTAALASRPFISTGLSDAYLTVSRVYNDEPVSWLARAGVRYHKLGPLLRNRVQSIPEDGRRQTIVDELAAVMKQPVTSMVATILRALPDPSKLEQTLHQIVPGLSTHRRTSLISYLTAEGATDAVDRILLSYVDASSQTLTPFSSFATVIKLTQTSSEQHQQAADLNRAADVALQQLAHMTFRDVTTCFKGPHVEILFRSWPADRMSDLVKVVCDTSSRERNSCNLQLAAVLVNRGLSDSAEQLFKAIGPLPVTFLAGSIRHVLTPAEFASTVTYLNQRDPDHVSTFADTCLRNSVSCPNSIQQTNGLIALIRSLTTESHSIDLAEVCLPTTVGLVTDFLVHNPNLPNDVRQTLQSIVDRSQSPGKRHASG